MDLADWDLELFCEEFLDYVTHDGRSTCQEHCFLWVFRFFHDSLDFVLVDEAGHTIPGGGFCFVYWVKYFQFFKLFLKID